MDLVVVIIGIGLAVVAWFALAPDGSSRWRQPQQPQPELIQKHVNAALSATDRAALAGEKSVWLPYHPLTHKEVQAALETNGCTVSIHDDIANGPYFVARWS